MLRVQVAAAAQVPEDDWKEKELYRATYNASPGTFLPVLLLDDNGKPVLHVRPQTQRSHQ